MYPPGKKEIGALQAEKLLEKTENKQKEGSL